VVCVRGVLAQIDLDPAHPAARFLPTRTRLPMWEQSESGHVSHQFEPVILIATLAVIPVLVIEYDTTSAGTGSGPGG
jgi:hypothetical protein